MSFGVDGDTVYLRLIQGAQEPLRIGCFREVQKSIKDSVHKLLEDQNILAICTVWD